MKHKFEFVLRSKPISGPSNNYVNRYQDANLKIKKVESQVFEEFVEKRKQSSKVEYFTVKYKYTMTRKLKRLFLQTYLDSLVRREECILNFADFLILEDLYQSIKDDMMEPDYKSKYENNDIQLLYITELFLKYCPAQSIFLEREGIRNFSSWIIDIVERCEFFTFSNFRTYMSRIKTYAPSKILEVTVEVPLQDDVRSSKRYSSYTKGHPTPGRKGEAPLPNYLQPGYDSESRGFGITLNHYLVQTYVQSLLDKIKEGNSDIDS